MHASDSFRAVIIDLDGTLIDTAGEIGAAMGRTLDELKLPRIAAAEIETMIGRGVRVLVERALARLGAKHVDLDAAVERFQAHYAQTVGTTAVLFPGAMDGVRRLHDAGLKLAVVTNKPRFFSERLLARAEVDRFFAAIVAGDDGHRRKPEGDMLLAVCRVLGTAPAETLMLGDSDNDVLAARAAGCPVWCVPYGYNEGRPAESLACDRLVATIEEAALLLAAR
jgi:phosphoglycolate phosphatase